MFGYKYPYTDLSQLNLDWVIKEITRLSGLPLFEIPITFDENDDPVTTATPAEYDEAVRSGRRAVITVTLDNKKYKFWCESMEIDGKLYPDVSYHQDALTGDFCVFNFIATDPDQPFTVYLQF